MREETERSEAMTEEEELRLECLHLAIDWLSSSSKDGVPLYIAQEFYDWISGEEEFADFEQQERRA